MKTVRLSVTTASNGAGTSALVTVPGGGLVYAIQCVDGDLADGVDVTITSEQGEFSIPVFAVLNFNADGIYYPRVPQNLSTDGTALTTHCLPIVPAAIKAVVAQGGDTKTGAFILYVLEA